MSVLEAFTRGAQRGFAASLRLLPTLVRTTAFKLTAAYLVIFAVFAALDLSTELVPADVYLILTGKELFVLTGHTSSSGKPGKKFGRVFNSRISKTGSLRQSQLLGHKLHDVSDVRVVLRRR